MTGKLDKAEKDLLETKDKLGQSEQVTNHMRRLMQSLTDEKTTLEAKLQGAGKERERVIETNQNLDSQILDLQLAL